MKFLKGVSLVAMLMFATAAFAQEAAKEEKPELKISGVGYLEWNKELSNKTAGEHENTFEIKRIYLNFEKKFDDVWSAKVTTDVGRVESEGEAAPSGDAVETKTNPYTVYVKYAYIQAHQKMDMVDAKLTFGMFGTPLIGLVDKQSDFRWIEQNYVDQSKNLLGTSIDNSADMGASLDLKFFKLIQLTGAILNGEGYKKVSEGDLGDDGKAYQGMLTVMPIEGLSIFGVYRNQVTDDAEPGDNYNRYMAFGASYSTSLIKVGAMYVMPKTAKAGVESEYTLLDSWLFANLESVVNVPVLIAGRYAYGENKDVDDSKITKWSAGLGYKFNSNVRALAYYESLNSDSYDDPETTVYVKTEVKF